MFVLYHVRQCKLQRVAHFTSITNIECVLFFLIYMLQSKLMYHEYPVLLIIKMLLKFLSTSKPSKFNNTSLCLEQNW